MKDSLAVTLPASGNRFKTIIQMMHGSKQFILHCGTKHLKSEKKLHDSMEHEHDSTLLQRLQPNSSFSLVVTTATCDGTNAATKYVNTTTK